MASTWYVYMVRCVDGSLYTGASTDPARREKEHNGERRGGAAYTASRRAVVLVWQLCIGGRADAMRAERAIKKLPASTKRAMVLGTAVLSGTGPRTWGIFPTQR